MSERSEQSDPFRLDGQSAIVTGGGNGIGRATAEVLAAAGASVVVADIDGAAASAVAEGIAAAGGRALALTVDTSDRAGVDAMVRRTVEEHGRLDAICNVAGVHAAPGMLVDIDEAELHRVVGVNLDGVVFCCQAAIRAMRSTGGGSIVNVSSSIIDVPAAGNALYAMTKAAVAMVSRVLADEVGTDGIRVNAIAPGPTLTEFVKHSSLDEEGRLDPVRWEAFLERMQDLSPLGLVGEPLDQAHLIRYLLSPAARLATGNVFRVNGGLARPW